MRGMVPCPQRWPDCILRQQAHSSYVKAAIPWGEETLKCLLYTKSGRTFHPRPTCFWMTDSLPSRQGVVALQGPSVDVGRHVGHAKSQCDRVMAWEPASQTEQGAFIWPHQGNLRNETAWGGSSWQLPICLSTPDLAQLPSITVCVWGDVEPC